jgi:Flp pilus assembly protein CpaB
MSQTPDPAGPTRPDPTDTAVATDRDRLDALLARWAAGRRAGSEPTPDDLCGEDPRLREVLRHRIAAERLLEQQPLAAGATVSFAARPDSGAETADRLPPEDLPSVPGYTVVRELGCGGMGVVYEAVQAGLNRPAALKMLLPDRRAGGTAAVRFLAEAEAVAAVRHPHVVQVYEFGQHAGRPFMAMELCPRSLKDLLQAGPLAPREAARLLAKVAQGVQAAHARQIVHRDLKPGNVLLDDDGEPKVTDFGLAKRGTGSDLTRTHAVMGTPDYMAPEQAEGRAKFVGPEADVWALGVILYECLTGVRPFAADDSMAILRRIQEEAPVSPRTIKRDVPRDLEVICLKCLEKEPADRYPTAAAVALDLDNFVAGRPILARPRSPIYRAWRFLAAHPVETCLVLVFGVIFLRFIVSNSENYVGASLLPPETNADLRGATNAAFIGAVAGAVIGGFVAVVGLVTGRRQGASKAVAHGAIAGLATFGVVGILIPSIGKNANATFSAVGPGFPAGGRGRGDAVKVLVAKRDIPVGTTFRHEDLDAWVRWADTPKSLAPPDAVTDLGAFDGAFATRTLRAGDSVAAGDLTRQRVLIPDGKKLIDIVVGVAPEVAGQIVPNARIDVLAVRRDGPGGPRAEVILKGVTVFAVHQVSGPPGGPPLPLTVSIAVDEEQAKIVALAEASGPLRVVLVK